MSNCAENGNPLLLFEKVKKEEKTMKKSTVEESIAIILVNSYQLLNLSSFLS